MWLLSRGMRGDYEEADAPRPPNLITGLVVQKQAGRMCNKPPTSPAFESPGPNEHPASGWLALVGEVTSTRSVATDLAAPVPAPWIIDPPVSMTCGAIRLGCPSTLPVLPPALLAHSRHSLLVAEIIQKSSMLL